MFAAVCNISSPFSVAFSNLDLLELFAFVADQIFWEVRPRVEPVKGCTSSNREIALQVLHLIKKSLKAFFSGFFFPAGLTILGMKVLGSCWMHWKSFWTRNSKDLDHLKGGRDGEVVSIFLMWFSSFLSRQESIDKKNQHKLIQCLKAFMNNKVSIKNVWVLLSSTCT